jgi:hypothetical protein
VSSRPPLQWTAPLDAYASEAAALFTAVQADDDDARWTFKWMHRRYRGQPVTAVRAAELTIDDARTVVANTYAFEDWDDLASFTAATARDPAVRAVESAIELVLDGDVERLRTALMADPSLARARSARRHHATLLHYLGANGVEHGRQRSAVTAPVIARLLLEAGADANALADLYNERCTTMSMLVSSTPPHDAGVTLGILDALLAHGAQVTGTGSAWQSAVRTALMFGFRDTAEGLVARGAPVAALDEAAGLGRADLVARLLPTASVLETQQALALAAQHAGPDVIALVLDAGADPNAYNPEGYHSHSTALHQAVLVDALEVAQLLVARDARTDIRDTLYDGTALDWAEYCDKPRMASWLRSVDGSARQ